MDTSEPAADAEHLRPDHDDSPSAPAENLRAAGDAASPRCVECGRAAGHWNEGCGCPVCGECWWEERHVHRCEECHRRALEGGAVRRADVEVSPEMKLAPGLACPLCSRERPGESRTLVRLRLEGGPWLGLAICRPCRTWLLGEPAA